MKVPGSLVFLTLSLLSFAVLSGMTAPTPPQSAVERPDFSGSWKRNSALSQDWSEKLEMATRPEKPNAWRRHPETQRFFSRIRRLLAGADQVEIEQTEKDIEIVSGDDEVRIFHFDGRTHLRENPNAVKIQATIRWEGKLLVIEEVTEDGSTIVETLSLESGARRIGHELRWENKILERPLLIHSVYERVEK